MLMYVKNLIKRRDTLANKNEKNKLAKPIINLAEVAEEVQHI